MNPSLKLNEGLKKPNIRYSEPSVPISSCLESHIRYSRYLPIQPERIFTNERSRIVIHVSIRSPTNNHIINYNPSLNSNLTTPTNIYYQDKVNHMDVNEMTHIKRRSLSNSINEQSQNRPISQSISNNCSNNNSMVYFPKQINKNTNVDEVSNRQYYSSHLNKERKRELSNIENLLEHSRRNKKKKEKYPAGCPCSCPCMLASFLVALLLCMAIAAALFLTLFKPQTTTTESTTSIITTIVNNTITITTLLSTTVATTNPTTTTSTIITTISTTMTSTIISTTMITSETTTTTSIITTTSISITLTTTTSCSAMSSTAASYSPTGNNYVQRTYNYIASSTGTALLEFAFSSTGGGKIGYLDDVSMVDTNASNSEILINGNFENGSLIGWQVICPTQCSGSSGSLISSSSLCKTGSFCYKDSCQGPYDMLRQIFPIITGHIYILTFWMQIDNSQSGFFRII